MVSVKHQLFKNSEKGVKTGKAYVQRSKWDSFLHQNGTLISFGEEFITVKKKHKEINFFVVFFVQKTMKAKIVNNEKH